MAEVVEINQIEELEHYYLLWSSLLKQTPGGSFFQSLDWLQVYWKHFGRGQKLRVLIVYSAGSPIGIVPLVVRREKTRIGRVKVLTYPLQDWGTFFGPVGPNPTSTLTTAMRHIRNTRRDWEILDLRFVNRDEEDRDRTPAAFQSAGFQPHESVWKETSIVDTNCTWEEYFATRKAKFRNNVRRHIRRAEQLGELEYERYRPQGSAHGDDDPRWDLYDQCVELAGRSWQGSSQTGTTLSHESVREFFRETHALAVKAGALDLNVLKLDGKVIAFSYNYHSDGYVLGMRIGSDPEHSKAGIGNVLYARVIQDSCARGDHTFDLGPGSMSAKRDWLSHMASSYHYTHYPLTARSQLLRVKHWLQNRKFTSAGGKAEVAV